MLWLSWASLVGCGELEVDLSDAEKDDLAAFVDRGGADIIEEPTPRQRLDTEGITSLRHLAWDALLGGYVDGEGRVDYSGFQGAADSRDLMSGYLDLLASLDPAQLESPQERLAFWLNAYNALVFQEAASRLADDAGFSTSEDDFSFFQARRYTLGGQVYSLDQIEHGVIRGDRGHASVSGLDDEAWALYQARHEGIFGQGAVDPRIHVGLNCGALSCPPLPTRAFTGANVDALLDERAGIFVHDAQRGAGPQGISMLFSWFQADFEAGPQGSARGFIEAYREDSASVNFGAFLEYDWTLNGR